MILFLGDPAISANQLRERFIEDGYVGGALCHEWGVAREDLAGANRRHELHGPEGFADRAELVDLIEPHRHEIKGIVTHFCPVSAALIEELPELSFIATVRSGTQNLDLAAAGERQIAIHNNPGRNAPVVADFAVGLMLATCRGIAAGHHSVVGGQWQVGAAIRGGLRTLTGMSVGLVGLGQIGARVARLLQGFDCQLRAFDPYVSPQAMAGALPTEIQLVDSLQELFTSSELVSLHAKVTPESTGIIARQELEWLGADGILINTARAELVDEAALVEALEDGTIGAAGLDVFSSEPLPPEHPLRRLGNVTLTPHLAGASRGAGVMAIRMLSGRLRSATDPSLWNQASPYRDR
jgi:D-3-phosphoglycerate dehydrogenase / 2-oxoglutarate reductase